MRTKDKCLKDHPNFKGNQYQEKENYLIGVDSKGNTFYISKEDYNECNQHCWSGSSGRKSKNGVYFSARMSRKSTEGNKMKMLHNFIWELHNGVIPEGYRVDHINQKPWDCRYENLRLADKSLNSINADLRENNSSGVTGVSFNKQLMKWHSYIRKNKKQKHLGYYANFDDAVKKRLEAERIYYKDFAPQKHLFKQYGIEAD